MLLSRLILTALLHACTVASAADDFVYVVQAGDHPWNIAQRYLKDTAYATQLVRLNQIANDRTVAPGTELRIPAQWLRLQSTRVWLVATQGEASVETGGVIRAARNGDDLGPGSRLRTGPRSSALLEFDDGSRVMLRQTSEMRLLRADQRILDGAKMIDIELLRGGLENVVTPARRSGSRFEIRSPAAVAAVRGTRFRFNASADTSWTEVLDGAVEVSNGAGAALANAGFGTVARIGRAPDAPRPLLPAPDISALPRQFERLPIDWPLPEVRGAAGYRTQIAPDSRFETLVSDEQTERPRARVVDVPDGSYVLRLRAIDPDRLEGLPSERAIEVFARPQPPSLIEPESGSQTTSPRPQFRWTRPDPSWNYRLQIFHAAESNALPLHEQIVVAAGQVVPGVDLAPGEYRWRMASMVPSSGRQGPWGDPQTFRQVLPSPALEPPVVVPGNTTVRWPALPHASSYVIQLAPDNTFERPLLEARSEIAQLELRDLAPGTYWLRLRATAQDGHAGPWGLPQYFSVPEPPPAPEPEPQPEHWRALLLLLPALLLFGL